MASGVFCTRELATTLDRKVSRRPTDFLVSDSDEYSEQFEAQFEGEKGVVFGMTAVTCSSILAGPLRNGSDFCGAR